MTLFLSETDIQELLPMERALECVEASFVAQGSGKAVNRSRERILLPQTSLHYMAAALPEEKWLGMKIYTVARTGLRFVVLLFDAETGGLLALMEADYLGRIRTGAASGVATKYSQISNLNSPYGSSGLRLHLYLCRFERDEADVEVHTQWVTNKTSPFSSRAMLP